MPDTYDDEEMSKSGFPWQACPVILFRVWGSVLGVLQRGYDGMFRIFAGRLSSAQVFWSSVLELDMFCEAVLAHF